MQDDQEPSQEKTIDNTILEGELADAMEEEKSKQDNDEK